MLHREEYNLPLGHRSQAVPIENRFSFFYFGDSGQARCSRAIARSSNLGEAQTRFLAAAPRVR